MNSFVVAVIVDYNTLQYLQYLVACNTFFYRATLWDSVVTKIEEICPTVTNFHVNGTQLWKITDNAPHRNDAISGGTDRH